MDTPVFTFVQQYLGQSMSRLHMPGHKGQGPLGCEALDITEIQGADSLYTAQGILAQSQRNATFLFQTGATFYSTEGSSQCIKAMLYLAQQQTGRRLVLAARNVHKAFVQAAALLDLEVQWLWAKEPYQLLSCQITAEQLEQALAQLSTPPACVYVTSPDYLGQMQPIGELAQICHKQKIPLLVDNAHGAYLKFLPGDQHPITLGASICCDSAHKTLPVLTGGAYLHIGKHAPDVFAAQAERAMALFASTSPSYLILQSLDRANPYLADGYRNDLAAMIGQLELMKEKLSAHGYRIIGNEPGKLTIAPKSYGYTGDQLHDLLRSGGMECEFSDPDFLVMMPTPALHEAALKPTEEMLLNIPSRAAIQDAPPALPKPRKILSIRQAMLSLQKEIPTKEALGKILADAHVGCPPCIPILAAGEEIDPAALENFRYYGVETCSVVAEE